MQDGVFSLDDRRAGADYGGMSQFAAEVVARLVSRDNPGGRVLREALVERFMAAVRSASPHEFEMFKPELRRARVSAATMADLYIPEVARRLGRAWEDDRATFAEVTMGVARLQAILREIGTDWVANDAFVSSDRTILLILPAGEQHTLGALVAAGWMRRKGISVCLRIAPSVPDLLSLMAVRRFDAAMISVGCVERLEFCKKLIKLLKEAGGAGFRVAVGGAVVESYGRDDGVSGADVTTNDLSVAVAALGLVTARA